MDLHAVFFTLILLTWTGVSFGQELLLPEGITNRAVGDDVEIIPLSTPNRPYILVRWAFNGTYILTSHPGGVDILPPYTDRAGLNTTTLALTLMRLRESDTGKYSLTVETSAQTFTAVTSLQVLKKQPGTVDSGTSLSPGAIAGIVIGVLVGVAGIAGLIVYLINSNKIPQTARGNKQNGAPPKEPQQELNYVDVRHLRNHQMQPGTAGLPRAQVSSHVPQHNKTATSNPATQTIYSDVRNI